MLGSFCQSLSHLENLSLRNISLCCLMTSDFSRSFKCYNSFLSFSTDMAGIIIIRSLTVFFLVNMLAINLMTIVGSLSYYVGLCGYFAFSSSSDNSRSPSDFVPPSKPNERLPLLKLADSLLFNTIPLTDFLYYMNCLFSTLLGP